MLSHPGNARGKIVKHHIRTLTQWGSVSLPARSLQALATAVVLGAAAAACGTSGTSGPKATPTTTTKPAPTTTTTGVPGAPQPSANDAASALVSDWASGNRASALSVATPQAVATLFAVPYPSGLAVDRGCSSGFVPVTCTFGAPGGGPPTASIFQLSVSQTSGGAWYVSSVRIES
jgi:hypothetical protein